ncbi:MAG: hypothetical protein U9N52_13960 [Campylobacterota bacterium]|nr:hypothetical protein [Campylobacterota bacterium]
MTKKISLTVNAKRYDIDIDEDFAPFLEQEMRSDFNVNDNNDMKLLLQAYVQKIYTLYKDEKKIHTLMEKLSKS